MKLNGVFETRSNCVEEVWKSSAYTYAEYNSKTGVCSRCASVETKFGSERWEDHVETLTLPIAESTFCMYSKVDICYRVRSFCIFFFSLVFRFYVLLDFFLSFYLYYVFFNYVKLPFYNCAILHFQKVHV